MFPKPKRIQDLSLRLPHAGFLFRLGMVVSQQMQDAVHDQQLHFRFERMTGGIRLGLGAGDRDEDVADITRTRFRVRFRGGEGEHIGRRVDAQIVQIQFLQVLVVRQNDGQLTLLRFCLDVQARRVQRAPAILQGREIPIRCGSFFDRCGADILVAGVSLG